jgi:DHA1 family bicyclomycin/chloramphenicol resistance-like MFS transporter
VQASLTAFFLALGVGQPLFGSLADLWGRKNRCTWAWPSLCWPASAARWRRTFETLVVLRFIQGLGAAAGMAFPRRGAGPAYRPRGGA